MHGTITCTGWEKLIDALRARRAPRESYCICISIVDTAVAA